MRGEQLAQLFLLVVEGRRLRLGQEIDAGENSRQPVARESFESGSCEADGMAKRRAAPARVAETIARMQAKACAVKGSASARAAAPLRSK